MKSNKITNSNTLKPGLFSAATEDALSVDASLLLCDVSRETCSCQSYHYLMIASLCAMLCEGYGLCPMYCSVQGLLEVTYLSHLEEFVRQFHLAGMPLLTGDCGLMGNCSLMGDWWGDWSDERLWTGGRL